MLKKCKNKFDFLVYEMLFIRSSKPNLNLNSSQSLPSRSRFSSMRDMNTLASKGPRGDPIATPSADIVKKQLKDLSLKVHTTIQPVFVSRKTEQELNVKETKPPIVNQLCAVYDFQCDLCDGGYVGYTRGHLHNHVKGHKQQSSVIANMHGTMPQGLLERFKVLKKCKNKFDCLVYEMLFIRSLKPNLNVQADSIRAKVFL